MVLSLNGSRIVLKDPKVLIEQLQVSSTPAITSTGKNLTSYSYFDHTMQLVANLLVQIDPRTEESLKVCLKVKLLLSLNDPIFISLRFHRSIFSKFSVR